MVPAPVAKTGMRRARSRDSQGRRSDVGSVRVGERSLRVRGTALLDGKAILIAWDAQGDPG